MLATHNSLRATVKVPPLKWSPSLAGEAQEWANRLVANGRFEHRSNSLHGENLFEIVGRAATPVEVVGEWRAESANYDYRGNKCRGATCGHYTQLVWAATRQVGCGVARNSRREIWVCNYDPPGNVVGQRPY